MRRRTLALGLILAARTLFAQEAVSRDSIVAGQSPAFAITAPVTGNTWIDLESSESVMIPMHGITTIDVEVPGDGKSVRGAYLEWMSSSEMVHPPSAGSQDVIPAPFAATLALHAPAQDSEEFGAVTASLSADLIRIGSTSSEAAVFEFGLESQPLLALITFEIASPRIDSPPEVIANSENVGTASLVLPGLADPGYRGELRNIVSQMQFQYTGWLRAQKIVPVSALHAGTNNITIIN